MLETKKTDGSGVLFNNLIAAHDLKNDAGLARKLRVAPPVISKVRHFHVPPGDKLILNIHETFGMPVAEIRAQLKGGAA